MNDICRKSSISFDLTSNKHYVRSATCRYCFAMAFCLCQLVRTPISSDVEAVNVSTTGTDVTVVFTAETAPMKSAVSKSFYLHKLWHRPTVWC